MDLKIDAELIRNTRKQRAWSQEHLAEVANLGRRTIQRIEQNGAASFESAQAIASALELNVSQLIVIEEAQVSALQSNNRLLRKIYAALSAIAVLLLLALGRAVTADEVHLEIDAMVDNAHQTRANITRETGQQAEIELAGDYRITVTPIVHSAGDIQLDVVLLKLIEGEYQKVGGPVLRTADGISAVIKSALGDGASLDLEIKASLL